MKKAEKQAIIQECINEFERSDTFNADDGTWKHFKANVLCYYDILRKHFGKVESKHIAIDYFCEEDTLTEFGKTWTNKMQLAMCQEALERS